MRRALVERYGVVFALLALSLAAALFIPGFVAVGNLTTILLHVSVNAILALGMTFVIVTGGIDLSVGSLVGLAGVLTAAALTSAGTLAVVGVGGATLLAVVVGMGTGAAVGAANGAVAAYGRIAPFVVTLATMTIARGAARLVTGGVPIGFPAEGDAAFAQKSAALEALHAIGGGRIPVPGLERGFPMPALIMLALVAAGAFVLKRTRFGRYVYAISGGCAGLAAILLVGQLKSGGPDAGLLYELNAIAAAVIGGASLLGGVGTAWGALVGALLIGVLNNGLDLLSVQSFWQEIAKGAIILFAVTFDVWTKRGHRHA